MEEDLFAVAEYAAKVEGETSKIKAYAVEGEEGTFMVGALSDIAQTAPCYSELGRSTIHSDQLSRFSTVSGSVTDCRQASKNQAPLIA